MGGGAAPAASCWCADTRPLLMFWAQRPIWQTPPDSCCRWSGCSPGKGGRGRGAADGGGGAPVQPAARVAGDRPHAVGCVKLSHSLSTSLSAPQDTVCLTTESSTSVPLLSRPPAVLPHCKAHDKSTQQAAKPTREASSAAPAGAGVAGAGLPAPVGAAGPAVLPLRRRPQSGWPFCALGSVCGSESCSFRDVRARPAALWPDRHRQCHA